MKLRTYLKEGQIPFLISFLIFWATTTIPSPIGVPKEEEEGHLFYFLWFFLIHRQYETLYLSMGRCGIIACECPLRNFRAWAGVLLEVASSK